MFRRAFSSCRRLSTYRTLPEWASQTTKVEMAIRAMGRFRGSPSRRGRDIVQRVGSTYGGTHSMEWMAQPRTVLIVTKQENQQALEASHGIIDTILKKYPDLHVVAEPDVYAGYPGDKSRLIVALEGQNDALSSCVDFVVAVGGDGTLLRVSSMFDKGAVPPVIGVKMGTVGFLMPVSLSHFEYVLDETMQSRSTLLLRMRLQCRVNENNTMKSVHAMNEVVLKAATTSKLLRSNVEIDGQHLTEVISDGLILATPTGSTAYSLSAGGPIVHPSVQSMLLNAIAPRSLSFRSVLLPSDVSVCFSVSPLSRTPAYVSLDGHQVHSLEKEESICIQMSPYPVPCISKPLSRLSLGIETTHKEHDSWLDDLSNMLQFNAPFKGMEKPKKKSS